MRMIDERPAEVDDRVQAGHWEGDLIMGAGNRSAIGTLVERTPRFVVLLPFTDGMATTDGVRDAITGALESVPGGTEADVDLGSRQGARAARTDHR
jgi:IS30 family transposase